MSAEDHLGPQFTGSTSLAEGHRARKDGTVPLYHRTRTAESAEGIRNFGFKGSTSGPDKGEVYFSSRRSAKAKAHSYGEHLITVDMPHNHPWMAHADTWDHKDGSQEHWYSLPADRIDPSWIRP